MMQNILKLIESVLESEAVQRKAAELLYEVAEAINPESVPLGWERITFDDIPFTDGCHLKLYADFAPEKNIVEILGYLCYPVFLSVKEPILVYAYLAAASSVPECVDLVDEHKIHAVEQANYAMDVLRDQGKIGKQEEEVEGVQHD